MDRTLFAAVVASGALVSAPAVAGAQPAPAPVTEERTGHAAVSSARAADVAEAWVERRRGPAEVTGVEREDDFGARWEVEVTLRGGAEYDVYVDADGRVVRAVAAGSARPPARPAGPVAAARAARAAEAYVERRRGPARVTGVEREDDFGARWEVEVTLRSGAEYDVYVDREGTIIRMARSGND